MTMTFTQGHMVMRKLELCNHSTIDLCSEVAQTFVLVDYVREMTAKKSQTYGKMGHLSICSSWCQKWDP